jgi:hypothetical protein
LFEVKSLNALLAWGIALATYCEELGVGALCVFGARQAAGSTGRILVKGAIVDR